jgi:hypothetical protein
MFTRFGKVEIWCDAPPYPVVEGCSLIGIHSPEDVRWCRLSHFVSGSFPDGGLHEVLAWLKRLFGGADLPQACLCGAELPALAPFRLLCGDDDQPTYLIGQCPRCHTVFWEEDSRGWSTAADSNRFRSSPTGTGRCWGAMFTVA